ncbi:MAG: UDP-glucose 4-epimerase GalE [Planctomycetota bacterium]
MNVLVTGGAGYIGSVVVEVLVERGYRVTVFDDLSQGHFAAVSPAATFHEGSLADRSAVDGLLASDRFDAVMHFASKSLVGESMSDPFLYFSQNVGYGIGLIESATKNGVKRFVLSSTANLFGEAERMPIDESERVAPGSPYGETKHVLERVLHWAEVCCGMRSACLRYFNAAGATTTLGEDHDPETHLIPIVLDVAAGRRANLKIFGNDYATADGTCVRDYIHVADLATAHVAALDAISDRSVRFNLGSGTGSSVLDVIRTVEEVTGRTVDCEFAPRRHGDPAVLIASSDAIRRELGWQPGRSDLRTIIEDAWAWRSRHPDGYGNQRPLDVVT